MSFKSKIVIKLAFLYAAAAALLIMGCFRGGNLFAMGTTMAIMAVALSVRFALLARSKEKLAALETDSHDERTIFVSMKSYSFAFWFSILGEFVAYCALEFVAPSPASAALCFIISFQALCYVVSYLVFNKKY